MFDHLDSSPDVPDSVALQAVRERGRQLVRRRRFFQASAAVVVAFGAFGVSQVAFGGQGRPDSLVVVSPTGTPTPTPTPTPSGAPTATPSPTTASHPVPAGPVTATITPTPSPSCVSQFNTCPDGKPGWSTGFSACTVPTSAPTTAGRPPVAGMSLELVMPSSTTVGKDLSASLLIHNDSGYDVSMAVGVGGDMSSNTAEVFGPGGGGAIHTSDAVGRAEITIAAGQTYTARIDVPAHTCSDAGGPEPALPAGNYEVGGSIYYESTRVVDSSPSATPSASPQPAPAVNASATWTVVQSLTIR